MKSRKSIALNQAFGAVLTLVLVAVLVVVGIYLFSNLSDSFVDVATVAITNETGGFINSTGYTLTNSTVCNFEDAAITQVLNATDGVLITSGNYTLTGSVLANATETTWTNVLVSYTYNWGAEACEASQTSITQFASYPALVGLVGTIIFLGLVIGVLVASFVFRRNRA